MSHLVRYDPSNVWSPRSSQLTAAASERLQRYSRSSLFRTIRERLANAASASATQAVVEYVAPESMIAPIAGYVGNELVKAGKKWGKQKFDDWMNNNSAVSEITPQKRSRTKEITGNGTGDVVDVSNTAYNEPFERPAPGSIKWSRNTIAAQKKKMAGKKTYKKRVPYKRSSRYGKMVLTRGPTYSPELKHTDTTLAMTLNNLRQWTIQTINCFPTQGTDFTNRIGRRIFVKKIDISMRYAIVALPNVPLVGDSILCDFWLNTKTNGAAAAIGDIYSSNDPTSLPNPSNLSKFKRYGRAMHQVDVTASNAGVTTAANVVELYQKTYIVNKSVHFDASAANITDVVDNSWYITCCCGNAQPAGAYDMVGVVRVWFTDA